MGMFERQQLFERDGFLSSEEQLPVLVGDNMPVPLLRDNSGPQSATAPKQRHLPAKPIADRSQQKLFSKNFLQSAANIEAV